MENFKVLEKDSSGWSLQQGALLQTNHRESLVVGRFHKEHCLRPTTGKKDSSGWSLPQGALLKTNHRESLVVGRFHKEHSFRPTTGNR
jgi:hypothetical protein